MDVTRKRKVSLIQLEEGICISNGKNTHVIISLNNYPFIINISTSSHNKQKFYKQKMKSRASHYQSNIGIVVQGTSFEWRAIN
jgi:hypothetical protein